MKSLFQALVLMLSLSPGFSQTEPPQPPAGTPAPPAAPAPAPTPVPEPTPAPATAPVAAPPQATEPPKERTVYIPFADLAKTLANEGQGVFLPYREFLDMWNQLTIQQAKETIISPAEAVLSSLDYTGSVTGDVASITATLQVESFKENGWATLPLLTSALSIAKADTGDATLRLTTDKGYELLLPKKGKYAIKLDLMARVERNSGRYVLKLALPRAPVSRCTLTIPEEGWEFRLQPVAAHTVKPNGQGGSELSFFFGEAETIEVAWQKQGGETKLTPLIFAEMNQTIHVGAGTVQQKLDIDYRILRSGVDKFTLLVPKPHEVLSVSGENIKEWNLAPSQGEAPQELTVTLHSPARDQFHLAVNLEATVDTLPAELKVPAIEVKDTVRQRGSLLLTAPSDLDASLKNLNGLNQQEITGRPQAPASEPVLASHRYLKFPFAATLAVKRAEPVVEISTATLVQVALDTIRFTTSVDANVKRSGIFNLRIQVPMDFDAIEASGAPVESSKLEEADGKRFLDVRFKSRATGSQQFLITGRHNRETPAQPIVIPVFDPQNVLRHEAIVALALHESLDPNTRELGGLRQEDVANIEKQLPASKAAPESHLSPPSLAFRYRGGAAPGTITTKLKQSQVLGDVLTYIELREQAARYQWRINYDIQYAGVDSFTLSVPKAIAKDLRVDTRDLKEVIKQPQPAPVAAPAPEPATPANAIPPPAPTPPAPTPTPAPAAGEERELWKITLRDKRMGSFVLDLSLEVPVKDLTAGTTTEIAVPQIVLEEVFQEIGQTAVAKDGNLEVLDSKAESLESIDPKELRGILSRPGVILSYKNLRHPASLKLSISKNVFLEVPQAIVTYAVLNTVASTDGACSTEVIYWVKNNTLQYLNVELPERGRMLSDVYVNGDPQQPMQRAETGRPAEKPEKTDTVLIKIPGGDKVNEGREFPVRFLYEVPAPAAGSGKGLGLSGNFTLPVPKLNTGILQTQHTLYLPRDYVYLDFAGSMRPEPGQQGWSDPQSRLRWLVPVLGADITPAAANGWTAPPVLPQENKGGFNLQLPADGQAFPLHRLDGPSATIITYRSARMDAAVRYMSMLATFLVGLLLLKKTLEAKSTYFCLVGLGSLVARGLMSPAWAPLWESVWLGTLMALGVWLLAGLPGLFNGPAPAPKSPGPPTRPPSIPPSVRPPNRPFPGPSAGASQPAAAPIPVEKSQLLFNENRPGTEVPVPPLPDPAAPAPPWLDDPPAAPPKAAEPLPPFPAENKPE